jgi:hypothetical protein
MSLEELLGGESYFRSACHVSTNVLHCFVCCFVLLLLTTRVSYVSALAGKPLKSKPRLVGLPIAACATAQASWFLNCI